MTAPVPMFLFCVCGTRHIDRGEFATKPHHTHACQHCGMVWRPAIVATVGVQFLPGFKDDDPAAPPATGQNLSGGYNSVCIPPPLAHDEQE